MKTISRTIFSFLILSVSILLNSCFLLHTGSKNTEISGAPVPSSVFDLPSSAIKPSTEPRKIALLLPLKGPLSASGQAIRNGFLAAYFYDQQHNGNTPNIKVFDTNQHNILTTYQNAVNWGADFIIGPLNKTNVDKLANSDLDVPTLALNTLTRPTHRKISNFYEFGLTPEDEAAQVAEKARQAGYQNALVITPAGRWGERIADAFTRYWQNQRGHVVAQLAYTSKQNLNHAIRDILHVKQSDTRTHELEKTLREKVRTMPRRRQDIDVIFLAALPEKARQIRPLLSFYFAGNIPIYATSTVYAGIRSPQLDRDLDGIIFCDAPWIIQPPTQLSNRLDLIKNHIQRVWKHSYQTYPRLYALGIDAYMLTYKLNALFQSQSIQGATGRLYIDQTGRIFRVLDWAQIKDGIATPI